MAIVSIIIPTYNRAHLVAEAIESVLNQTYSNFELIVVDDGSTDNTEETVRSFLDPRVKYVRQSNKGVSAARNMGIKTAIGEFIAFLDHDDLFLSEKLSVQLARMRHDPKVGLVYTSYFGTIGTEAPRRIAGACHSPVVFHHLLLGMLIHLSTALIRRSWLQQVGGFDEQLQNGGEDRDICLRLLLAGCEMVCVPTPLTIIRQQPNSLARASYHLREETTRVVLDKAFSDPRMPSEMQALRTRAFATQLVRLAAWAYTGLSPEIGRDFLARALVMDPTLSNENLGFLVNKLVDHVVGLSLGDPENTLQLIRSHLPGDDIFVDRLWRRLRGRFYEAAAFQAYQWGQRAECMGYVIRAVGQTPSSLHNRGLLSIFVRSLVGNQDSYKSKNHPQKRG